MVADKNENLDPEHQFVLEENKDADSEIVPLKLLNDNLLRKEARQLKVLQTSFREEADAGEQKQKEAAERYESDMK